VSARKLSDLDAEISECRACPRLVAWREQVAVEKRAAFRDQEYWGRPVPGFGPPDAPLAIVGLAPAAHGANRTGRIFTGDGVGASGDFLMAALHRAGFSNIATSQSVDDGLELTDVYIAPAVRCAPPQNKPLPEEIARCLPHLANEVAHLPNLQVVVALGKIGWDASLKLCQLRGELLPRPRPAFGHGARWTGDRLTLFGAYHPSRQNTNTGVLTPPMYDSVFRSVRRNLR